MSSYDGDNFDDGPRLHPGIRSALTVCVFLIGANIVNAVTLGASLVYCYPVQLIIYAINGVLAGYFAVNSGYGTADLPKVGAIAGFASGVLSALFYLIIVVILGIGTFGAGFLGLAGFAVCGPDAIVQIAIGAFAAWVYGRLRVKDDYD